MASTVVQTILITGAKPTTSARTTSQTSRSKLYCPTLWPLSGIGSTVFWSRQQATMNIFIFKLGVVQHIHRRNIMALTRRSFAGNIGKSLGVLAVLPIL